MPNNTDKLRPVSSVHEAGEYALCASQRTRQQHGRLDTTSEPYSYWFCVSGMSGKIQRNLSPYSAILGR